MKRLIILLILCITGFNGFAQNLRVTFSGSGDANRIDWVTATNLTTGEQVRMPGTATLRLAFITPMPTGINDLNDITGKGLLYPNPCPGMATFRVNLKHSQSINLLVRDLSGRLVAQLQQDAQAGQQEYSVTFPQAGVYIVTMVANQETISCRALCTEPGNRASAVRASGHSLLSEGGASESDLKSTETFYCLSLDQRDVILYRCTSGTLTSLLADLPDRSREYRIMFAACTDRHGRNYPVVNIGDQIWMAENLAFLPAVSPSSAGSVKDKYYYVYGNEGKNVTRAKAMRQYQQYGVLYNWNAARYACPMGWKVPDDADWQKLEQYLGMNSIDVLETGWRHTGEVGGKMKEPGTIHWIGPNRDASNQSGFSALPGGVRKMPVPVFPDLLDDPGGGGSVNYGGFGNLGYCGFFWTSSEVTSEFGYSRRFGCIESGVERDIVNKSLGLSVRCIKDMPKD